MEALVQTRADSELMDQLDRGRCPSIFERAARRSAEYCSGCPENWTLRVRSIEASLGWRLTWHSSGHVEHVGFVIFRTDDYELFMYVATAELCPRCNLAFMQDVGGSTSRHGGAEVYSYTLVCPRCGGRRGMQAVG